MASSSASVKELSWMVKDNLSSKHLVLSVEEMLVDLLQSPYSGEEALTLKPMASYQRMLLHRLADIFGLAHESIGEGEDRRIIIERHEDSRIPDVLVSDILEEGNANDARVSHAETTRQLLKRDTSVCASEPKSSRMPEATPCLSLEARQEAYNAARERILFNTEDRERVAPRRQRPIVPVVAHRMIAHALGKHTTHVSESLARGKYSQEGTSPRNGTNDLSRSTS